MRYNTLHNRILFRSALMLAMMVALFQSKAQDPMFSQFYNNPIYYNPGYIGLTSGVRTRFNYRNQWTGLVDDCKTYSFSMDIAERAIPGSGGLGLLVSSDKSGTCSVKANNVGIGTAARVPLYENMIAQLGFMVSYAQKSVNWDDAIFTDELHPRYGRINKTEFQFPDGYRVSYPDFSVGGVYRFTSTGSSYSNIQGTLGVAVHHVFQPNESLIGLSSKLPRKLVVSGDLVLEIEHGRSSSYRSYRSSGGFKLNPGFIYEKQAEFSTYSLGLNVLKSSLYFGAWMRNQTFDFFKAKDVIFTVGVNAPFNSESRMKIMYTYDYIVSDVRTDFKASHEISLVFEFDSFSLFSGASSGGWSPGYKGGRVREMECCPF